MMKVKRISIVLFAVAMILLSAPTIARAEAYTIEELYLTVELPEGVTVLTPDTSIYDEAWKKAGITDVSKELETFEDMGVKAMFVPNDLSEKVTLMRKDSEENMEIFNYLSMSDAEFEDYINGILEGKEGDEENLSDEENSLTPQYITTISSYKQEQTPFFRLEIKSAEGDSPMHEIVYSTVMNGYSISFDIYKNNGFIDEEKTIMKKLVDGARFTKIFTKEEAEEAISSQRQRAIIFLIAFVVLIAATIVFFKLRGKRRKRIDKVRKDEIMAYRMKKKEEESNGVVRHEEPKFVNETLYDDDVLKDFAMYDIYQKNLFRWLSGMLLCIGILLITYFGSSSLWIPLIFLALIIAYAYYIGLMGEKTKEKLIKKYKAGKSRTAITKFYDDHFTVTGIQYYTDYPYFQLTDARKKKNFVYLYNGPDIAYYVSLESFTQGDAEKFLGFLKERLGDKFK